MTATVQAVSISVWRATAGLAGWIVVSFSAAALGAFFTPGEWYAQLRKPSWNPPNWIFGPVWSALYAMMAISAWLIWLRGGFSRHGGTLSIFLVHLLFNAAWSPLFFGLKGQALLSSISCSSGLLLRQRLLSSGEFGELPRSSYCHTLVGSASPAS